MGVSNVKKVLFVLLVVWIGTLSYIWLPGIIPDYLHLWNKSSSNRKDLKLKDGIGQLFSAVNTSRALALQAKDRSVHVAIASDVNSLGGMIALINSIVSNTKSRVFFHLITSQDASSHLKTWVADSKLSSINYEVKVFPEEWVKGKVKVRGGRTELASPLNYARFYLPRLLPDIDGRVIYLDDDCIVQGDISELHSVKLKQGTLAAFAEDCLGMNKRINFMKNVYADYFDLKNKHFMALKIKPTTCAFNAGVFVTDLHLWRQNNVTKQLEHWLQLNTKEEVYGNERMGAGSQPPMMIVFHQKYTPLNQIWNVHFLGWSETVVVSKQYIKSAKLLHWSGHVKPWERKAAFQKVWDAYFLPDPTHKFQPVRKGIVSMTANRGKLPKLRKFHKV